MKKKSLDTEQLSDPQGDQMNPPADKTQTAIPDVKDKAEPKEEADAVKKNRIISSKQLQSKRMVYHSARRSLESQSKKINDLAKEIKTGKVVRVKKVKGPVENAIQTIKTSDENTTALVKTTVIYITAAQKSDRRIKLELLKSEHRKTLDKFREAEYDFKNACKHNLDATKKKSSAYTDRKNQDKSDRIKSFLKSVPKDEIMTLIALAAANDLPKLIYGLPKFVRKHDPSKRAVFSITKKTAKELADYLLKL
jgi:hypothetical protein